MEQISLIEAPSGLHELPSAKLKKVDKTGVHGWVNFYAAFSESFCNSALRALGVDYGAVVFDPFLGSGTTGVSACKLGASFVGWDLDPFACILSRAKVAFHAEINIVERYLNRGRDEGEGKFDAQAFDVFDRKCLGYASSVFARIRRKVQGGRKLALARICQDEEGVFDSEAVAVAALCIAASRAAKLVKGSNPTWYRRGLPGEVDDSEDLRREALIIARDMLNDLASCNADFKDFRVFNCDAKAIGAGVADDSVDYILTSPPYLTRIDYVINHLPNLLLLSGFVDLDVRALRLNMIGTPRILSKDEESSAWGEKCIALLNEIKGHSSYASGRYYYWTYVQYFRSMFSVIVNFSKKLKIGGKGLVVVQSSFYKDVYVPLSEIIMEMMELNGLRSEIVRVEEVKVNMRNLQAGRIDSDQLVRKSSEDVIYFKRVR